MIHKDADKQKVVRQTAKALSIPNQCRGINSVQSALLELSRLTANARDIDEFFLALKSLLIPLFKTENAIVIILNDSNHLQLSFCQNAKDTHLIEHFEENHWQESLMQLVFENSEPLHCDAEQRNTLLRAGIINRTDSTCVDWLGIPIKNGTEVFGVISIQSYDEKITFNEDSKSLLIFVAEQISSTYARLNIQALQASNLKLKMQVEEGHKAEKQLYFEAHHDALTQLPNRAVLLDRLSYSVKHLKRHVDYKFAVLFIDLDRFKIINDTLGHHAGDLFLIEIANRLRKCVRDNDVLARLGGDEFVILLDALQSKQAVENVAARIINIIEKPYKVLNNTLYSNASIGIALSSAHYKNANEILRDADAAMYQAKGMGRGRYVFFDESMREKLLAIMTLEQELRIAINENQFELHYQEIADLDANTTLGFEALLRWQHPSKGLLTPSEFLFLAEETGIILDIEKWVIEEVSFQLKQWVTSSQYCHSFIAINLSGRHLTQAKQLNNLTELITSQGIEPQRLILEFNETSFCQNPDLALKNLRKLKDFGVRLALDDYASGLSSFNFLHRYPFEFIKLDRSFVRSLTNNSKNLSLVKALHDLGEQFGYRLVAEGIESEETLKQLHSVGCDFGQGYHISRPEKLASSNPNRQTKSCA